MHYKAGTTSQVVSGIHVDGKLLFRVLDHDFPPGNICHRWNGANCMTVIADLAAADPRHLPQAKRVFSTTFQNAPSYNPTGNMIKRAGYGYVHSSYGDLGQKPLHVSSPSQWLNSYYGLADQVVEYAFADTYRR